jgi:hypothetical protein
MRHRRAALVLYKACINGRTHPSCMGASRSTGPLVFSTTMLMSQLYVTGRKLRNASNFCMTYVMDVRKLRIRRRLLPLSHDDTWLR